MKQLLKKLPGLSTIKFYVRILRDVCIQQLMDPQTVADRAHHNRDWDPKNPTEQLRYTRVLAGVGRQLGPRPWGRALELGCSDGAFTEKIYNCFSSIVACDVSPLAIDEAKQRLAGKEHVEIQKLDVVSDPLHKENDVVFAMNILEAVHGRRRLMRVAGTLKAALRAGGLLVVTATRLPEGHRDEWLARRFVLGADCLIDFLCEQKYLKLVQVEDFPGKLLDTPSGYCDQIIAFYRKIA